MNSFLTFLVLVVVTAVAFLLVPQFTQVPRWEYRIESPSDSNFTNLMNDYGKEGRELISARRASEDGRFSYEVILKRRAL